MLLIGNYLMELKFGGTEVQVSTQMIDNISVTLDVNRLLPTFRIVIKDATGILGEIVPYDKNSNKVTLGFARSDNPSNINTFEFIVKRRKPDSERRYQIEGILDVPDLLTSIKRRALTGNIKTSIESLANDDLGIRETEVGLSLDYDETIIQPRWTDAKLLGYLTSNLIGKNGESCYHCFVKNINGKRILVLKSLDELLSSAVKYKFIVAHKPYEDLYPVVEYRVFDNSQLIVDFGAKTQKFGYFDYDLGSFIDDSVAVEDCPALAERTLIDNDNDNDSVFVIGLGRSNDFTPNFHGRMKSNFYKRANGLINMWISTWGLENISPGDVIKIIFGESLARGQLFIYQHSGLWMVERVVHILGNSFMTNLLLTRNGIDTDLDNNLMKSGNIKNKG